MAYNLGEISAALTLNTVGFTARLREATSAFRLAGRVMEESFRDINRRTAETQAGVRNVGNSFKDLGRIVGGIVVAQVFYGAIQAIQSATSAIIQFSIEMEVAQASLTRMLGTSLQASGYIETMKDFAAVTEFTTEQTIEMSRRLTAMGFEASQTRDLIGIVVDEVSLLGGGAQKLDRIVYALGQIKNEAKLSATNIRQLSEATVPAGVYLQKAFGLTAEQAMNVGKQGIPGALAVKAILLGMQADSKGAAAAIANTVRGMVSTIRDDILLISESALKPMFYIAKGAIRVLRDTLDSTRNVLREKGIGGLINATFSESMQTAIRGIIAGLKYLAVAFVYLYRAIAPIVTTSLSAVIKWLGILLPVLGATAASITKVMALMVEWIPPIRYLGAVLGTLLVVNLVSSGFLFLYKVFRLGAIVLFITQAFEKLRVSLIALQVILTVNPVYRVVFIIATAIIALLAYFGALDSMINYITPKIANLFGSDLSEVFAPEDNSAIIKSMEEFNKALDLTAKGFVDLGEDADEAGNSVKDGFLASFDEVFTIPKAVGAIAPAFNPDAFKSAFDALKKIITDPIEVKTEFEEPPWWLIALLTAGAIIRWIWVKWFKPPPPPPPPQKKTKKKSTKPTQPKPTPVTNPNPVPVPVPVPKPVRKRDPVTGRFTKFVETVLADASAMFEKIKNVFAPQIPVFVTVLGIAAAIAAAAVIVLALAAIPRLIPVSVVVTGPVLASVFIALALIPSLINISTALTVPDLAPVTTALATVPSQLTVPVVIPAPVVEPAIAAIQSIPTTIPAAVQIITPTSDEVSFAIQETTTAVDIPIQKAFIKMTEGIKLLFTDVTSWLAKNWKPLLVGTITIAIAGLAVAFLAVPASVTAAVAGFTAVIVAFFTTLWTDIQPAEAIGDDLAKNIDSNVLSVAETSVESWGDRLKKSFANIWTDIIDSSNKSIKEMNDMAVTVNQPPATVTKPFYSAFNLSNIKGFATGGIVTRDTLARVGEGNKKEAIVPLENSGVIKSFAKSIAEEFGGKEPSNVNYIMIGTLIGDDRSITQLERKLNAVRIKEDYRKGLT